MEDQLAKGRGAAVQIPRPSSAEGVELGAKPKRFAVSIDIGGTFTDFVLQDRERRLIFTEKMLTSPDQPELAIFEGVWKLMASSGASLADSDVLLHAHDFADRGVFG